jgi:hypothetical protein
MKQQGEYLLPNGKIGFHGIDRIFAEEKYARHTQDAWQPVKSDYTCFHSVDV